VLYSELISEISDALHGGEDVEHAVVMTLETLGFVLPERLVRALSAALPAECAGPLGLGLSASRHQQRVRGARGAQPGALSRPVLERVQMVCAVLASALPPELVADLIRELPEPFQAAFEHELTQPTPARVRRGTLASGRPGAARPLSEAEPGSTHPLHSARPGSAHRDSVQSENPHADTKLSSAHGITQEREHHSLAEERPDRGRGSG
jgi:hypothetical protein